MRLELIEIETKKSKFKIAISITIILLFIILIAFLGFKQFDDMNKQYKKVENIMIEKQKNKHIVELDINAINRKRKENIDNIYSSDEKRVFLTFDDGPSNTVTPFILDLLKQENIKATFFELGSRIEFYPEITKRVYQEGHYIANHGYSHIYNQIYTTPQSVLDEYIKTEKIIKNAIENQEYNSQLFRFPGGSKGGKYDIIKKDAINILNSNNIFYVDWNALSGDNEGKKTKEEMIKYTKETSQNKKSVIILMHDGGDKILTYEVLSNIIKYFKEQGYNFKNFYDILK